MYEIKNHPVDPAYAKDANLTLEQYQSWYRESLEQPDAFWAARAEQFLTWFKPWSKVNEYDFSKGEATWFKDGKLNASFNCIDRHLESRADQVAIIWEGDDPNEDAEITYKQLHEQVCRLSNALKAWCEERRSCVHLYAHDSGGGLRHAGLCPGGCGAFGGVRRLLTGIPEGSDSGFRLPGADHRR